MPSPEKEKSDKIAAEKVASEKAAAELREFNRKEEENRPLAGQGNTPFNSPFNTPH